MNILYGLLSALFTLIGLTFVVCLHELGHLYFAKRYGVYCYEYSIGMGPKIISKKKKGHETKFSLRWVPLGGYVSMAGDEDDEDSKEVGDVDEPIVPKERTLAGISKPKQIMVMSAGIIVNFLLAFFLFFVRNLIFPVNDTSTTRFDIIQESAADRTSDLMTGDKIIEFTGIEFSDENTQKAYNALDQKCKDMFVKPVSVYKDISYPITYTEGNGLVFDFRPDSEDDTVTRYLKYQRMNADGNIETRETQITMKAILNEDVNENDLLADPKLKYTYEIMGLQVPQVRMSFTEAFTTTFVDFGNSIASVYIALGSLFTPQGLQNVGGLISIFVVNQQAMTQGISTVLYIWGLLSANLGVFNLLPFPGLDGWQICVSAYEGVTKKKVPQKVKGIINLIGMILLIALFVLLIFVDIFRYI